MEINISSWFTVVGCIWSFLAVVLVTSYTAEAIITYALKKAGLTIDFLRFAIDRQFKKVTKVVREE